MKVVCTAVPSPVEGLELEESPWVTVGREYHVVTLLVGESGRVELRLITDDGSLGLFNARYFAVSDGSVPTSWRVELLAGGGVDVAPARWMGVGFWEAYYDREPDAVAAVKGRVA